MTNLTQGRRYSLRDTGFILSYALAGTYIGGIFSILLQNWVWWPITLVAAVLGGIAASIWVLNQPANELSSYLGLRTLSPLWIRIIIADSLGGEIMCSPHNSHNYTQFLLLPKDHITIWHLFYCIEIPTEVVKAYFKSHFNVVFEEAERGTYMYYVFG